MIKLSLIIYSTFIFTLGIFSYLFIDSNLFYLENLYSGFHTINRFWASFVYILFILLFLIFYLWMIFLIAKKKLNIHHVFLLVFLTVFILVFSYPAMLSYDIFNYIFSAKVLFFYGENPYIIMPIEFISDPLLHFTHAANKIALYGPFWIALTSIPHFLGLGSFVFTLFSFKIFVSVFYLMTVFLIWKMSKSLVSTSLFALNPLVIIESVVSAHNDIVMVFFALFSVFLLKKNKIMLAIMFLISSILVKYSTIFLVPVFLFVIYRKINKRKVNYDVVYYLSFLSMFMIFILSPIREEMYPWYGIWFLVFAVFLKSKKYILYFSIALSFTLLLRYVPFMLTGIHAGITPMVKMIITWTIPLIVLFFVLVKNKIWLRIFSR